MGLAIKAALGALVVLLIGVLAKQKLLHCRADSALPDVCAHCTLHCRLGTRH